MLSLHHANPVDERIDALSFGQGPHAEESLRFFKSRVWFHPNRRGSKQYRPPTFLICWCDQLIGMVALTVRKLPFGLDGAVVRLLSVEVMGIDVGFQGAPGPDGGTLAVAVMDHLKHRAEVQQLDGVSLRVRAGNARGRAYYSKCGFSEAAPPIVEGEQATLQLVWWRGSEPCKAMVQKDDQSSPAI